MGWDDSRVLVAGGAGFLGSHLVDALLDVGADVTVVDDLSTGDRANLSRAGIPFIEADVCTWEAPDRQWDVVFNLASPASPVHYRRLALSTLRVGSLGTDRLLGLAVGAGATFVQASTSEVYGDPLQQPQVESYWGHVNPVGPRAMYDEAKRYAEALCTVWRDQHDARVRIARIFNTYGPRMAMADGRVVPNFVSQALRGEPLTVYGDGDQTRSFCFVSDLVDGLMRLAVSDVEGPVNLGHPEEVRIEALARTILERTGSSSPLVHRPLPDDDPRRRRPDIQRARTRLDWAPRVSLEDGLDHVITDLRARLA